jgi:hypothetical protein
MCGRFDTSHLSWPDIYPLSAPIPVSTPTSLAGLTATCSPDPTG